MPTVNRAHRANLTENVDVALAEDEHISTQGDRRRGLNTRREARIVGYHLEFAWIDPFQRWDLREEHSHMLMQQKRNDGTWGDPQPRSISYDAGPAIETAYGPSSSPAVTW